MGNTSSFLKTAWQSVKREAQAHPGVAAISVSLACVPLLYSVNSAALGLLALTGLLMLRRKQSHANAALWLPVALYGVMLLSVFWTIDNAETNGALSKELALVLIPLAFMAMPPFSGRQRRLILEFFGWAMALHCLWYVLRAVFRYFMTGDTKVFFYHELVHEDVNAIHVSVYVSTAFFIFLTKPSKRRLDYAAIGLLLAVLFLLSSKNVLLTFFFLLALYLFGFSQMPKRRIALSAGVMLMLGLLAVSVPKVRERFGLEYRTAANDNTYNAQLGANVRNVSVSRAWSANDFTPSDFFPGTAFRVYQFRVFLEIMSEDNAWLTGYGLNASYPRIDRKTRQHNLWLGADGNSGYQKKNFHDQYVQNFAELGVSGFLLLVAMVALNLKTGWKRKDFVHISFAILMISLFLTESFLWRQRGVTFFALLYCLFNGNAVPAKEKTV
jgi:hypothetical protein